MIAALTSLYVVAMSKLALSTKSPTTIAKSSMVAPAGYEAMASNLSALAASGFIDDKFDPRNADPVVGEKVRSNLAEKELKNFEVFSQNSVRRR